MPETFPKLNDYIDRYVKNINGEIEFERKSIFDILEKENQIVLLGVAGLGKSVELENIAYHYSQPNSKYRPILISLNNITSKSIKDVVINEFDEFEKYNKDELILLFDGLDEVHVQFIDVVIKNINLFVMKYPDIKVVVSCRNNFYAPEVERGSAMLEKFKTYILEPIEFYDIKLYIDSKVNENKDQLFKDLDQRRLFDLLSTPFYLVKIIEYYNERLKLPKTIKEVFEYLIQKRIEKDLDKYKTSGIKIEEFRLRINDTLEKIAMVMQFTGKNILETEKIFETIIIDTELSKIIKHTFLFNKTNRGEEWQFEHNNFKEFLAAQYLSKLTLKEIKRMVSYKGESKKVKPIWLNTVSLLFSILPQGKDLDNLTSWLFKIEPDALIRFEKDKLPKKKREELFYKHYRDFTDKGIAIRSDKFEIKDLALLVSDSQEVLNYLISHLELTNDKVEIFNILELIKNFDVVEYFEDKIKIIFLAKLEDINVTDESKNIFLKILSVLGIYSNKLTNAILDVIILNKSDQNVRTGFYYYLENAKSQDLDSYLNILLDGALLLSDDLILKGERNINEIHLTDEKDVLVGLFKKLNSFSSAEEILKWILKQEEGINNDGYYKIIGETINRVSTLSISEKQSIKPLMVRFLFNYCEKYNNNLDDNFKEYFGSFKDPSENVQIVLDKILDKNLIQKGYDHGCNLLLDSNAVEYIIDEIKNKTYTDDIIIGIRNLLRSSKDRDLVKRYYDFIIDLNSKYEFEPSIDYDKLENDCFLKDRELIFSRESFIEEVNSFFEIENTSQLSIKQLQGHRKSRKYESVIGLKLLEDIARHNESKIIQQEDVVNYLKLDLNWNNFVIGTLISWDKIKPEFEYTTKEKSLLNSWLDEVIKNCDFTTAVSQNGNSLSFNNSEYVALNLIIRLDYELKEDVYLDILFVAGSFIKIKQKDSKENDESSSLISWVVEKTNLDIVKKRIIDNIKSKTIINLVRKNSYAFCAKHKVPEIRDNLLTDIRSSTFEYYDKKDLVKYYVECGGDLIDLLPFLNILPYQVNLKVLDMLFNSNHTDIKDVTVKLIESETDEVALISYINELIKVDQNLGFDYQKDWIIRNRNYPDRWYRYDKLSKEKFSGLLFLFQQSLILDFGKTSWMGQGRNDCLLGIIEIACKNKRDYKLAKRYFNSWIRIKPEEKNLYYYLQRLDQAFYSNISSVLDFDDAYARVINPSSLKVFKLDYYRDKPKVEILGLKVGVVGIVIGIIGIIFGIISFVIFIKSN